MNARRLAAAVVALALGAGGAAACGSATAVAAPIQRVSLAMVPPQIGGPPGEAPFTLNEYAQGARRLDNAGPGSMVADGRVFEIRRGSVLVGALQISTLRPKVNVGNKDQRDKLASLVVSGSLQTIHVSGVEVVAARTADKVVFLWFGDQLFEVLQIKAAGANPEQMLRDVIDFQRPTGVLRIKTGASS